MVMSCLHLASGTHWSDTYDLCACTIAHTAVCTAYSQGSTSYTVTPPHNSPYVASRRFFSEFAESCNTMDEVWVPSEFSRDVLKHSGVQESKIQVMGLARWLLAHWLEYSGQGVLGERA